MRFKWAFNLSHWSKSISAIGFRDHPKVTWITQKSLGVILKEEKEEKVIHFLSWADWEKESKRAREISGQGGEGDSSLAHIPRQQLSRFVQLIQHIVKDRFLHKNRGAVCWFFCTQNGGRTAFIAVLFAVISRLLWGTGKEISCKFACWFFAE